MNQTKLGFTLIELLIVLAIITLLYSFFSLGNYDTVPKNSLNSTTVMLIAHLKEQQMNALSGATEGGSTSNDFGVYFTDGKYVFFQGNSYDPNDSHNFSVVCNEINFSTTLPNSSIVFLKNSGQVKDALANNTITLTQKNIIQLKTITINKYGIIESIL